jgi:hypothetical protein
MRVFFFLLSFLLLLSGSASTAGDKDVIVVDTFAKPLDSRGLPPGWEMEKEPGPKSIIEVGKEDGLHFLHLVSVNDNFGLKKDISAFDIRKYPYLTWRWKAVRLPPGGDVRKRETDDQAGQIYVLFPKFPATINTRSVGYLWDSKAPVGSFGTSTAYSKMKYFVLQSGPDKLNQWMTETRNVYEDFKKLFDEDPPKAGGVLIYINTQHTASSAEIYYADIVFSATPPKGQGK